MGETDDGLIDVKQVARMYSVNPGTVWNWTRQHRIPQPVKRKGTYTRWLKSDVLADIRRVDVEAKAEAAS
jgi:predicted DNA-binding transcriptional regulator AlpA